MSGMISVLIFILFTPKGWALPTFSEVKSKDISSELILQDRSGYRFDSLRLNLQYRQAPWVSLAEIAPLAKEILVATEDQRFFNHEGVDWFSIASSAVNSLRGKNARGASTITMQLVSLIDPSRTKRGKRNLEQKWDQIKSAIELEKYWTKDQILEAYLNLVPLRGELVGIHSAARFLFKKEVNALDPVDAALVVALLPAPNDSIAKINQRACIFLKHVYETNPGQADSLCSQIASRSEKLLPVVSNGAQSRATESYARFILNRLPAAQRKGGILKTSLDGFLQNKVLELARETLHGVEAKHVSEIAAIVYKNDSGEVLSYLGNVPEYSKTPHVDGVQANRQAGSTLKPFFFAQALQLRYYDLNSTLDDEPTLIQTSSGAFRPDNYDHQFRGKVSLPLALASSLNIPAIQVVERIGVDESVDLLKKLGFENLRAGYLYGPSLALGTVDLSLEKLTHAYLQFANQALGRESSRFPIKATEARIISRILSDNSARAATFGLNSVLNTPYFAAVKTGTSKDMRDNWCIGFSEHYTVGVWVGNFDGTPMNDVSGVSGAAPLWRKIMNHLNDKNPSRMPDTIAKIELPKIEIAREKPSQGQLTQILYPQKDAILALDPEIPSDRQKVLFRAKRSEKNLFWFLNDEKLGALDQPYLWEIKKGKFQLEIRNELNEKLDSIPFSVR